jgi:hypothetical protein
MKDLGRAQAPSAQGCCSSEPLRIVHPDAGGIDMGSHKHYVAIPRTCRREAAGLDARIRSTSIFAANCTA